MVYILPPELHGRVKDSGSITALETFHHESSDDVSARGHEVSSHWSFSPPCILLPKVLSSFATLLPLRVIKALFMALSLGWKDVTWSNSSAVGGTWVESCHREHSCGTGVPKGPEGFRWLPGEQLSPEMTVCSGMLPGRHVPRYLHGTGKQVLLRGEVKLQSQEQQQRQGRACPSLVRVSGRRGSVPAQPTMPPHPLCRTGSDTDGCAAKELRNKRRLQGHNSFSHSFHLIFFTPW